MPVAILPEQKRDLSELLRAIDSPYMLFLYGATDDDFEAIGDDDIRCEYADGVLIVHSPASAEHERDNNWLSSVLTLFAAARGLGTVYGPNTVMVLGGRKLCADIGFLATAHLDRHRTRRIHGAMDLIIERLSPSTRRYDLADKRHAYREAQAPEIWFLDPDNRVCEFDVLDGNEYLTTRLTSGRWHSRVVPGFWINVSWLWSDPPPSAWECLQELLATTA